MGAVLARRVSIHARTALVHQVFHSMQATLFRHAVQLLNRELVGHRRCNFAVYLFSIILRLKPSLRVEVFY